MRRFMEIPCAGLALGRSQMYKMDPVAKSFNDPDEIVIRTDAE